MTTKKTLVPAPGKPHVTLLQFERTGKWLRGMPTYKQEWKERHAEHGGWDPKAKKLTPIRKAKKLLKNVIRDSRPLYHVLDSLVAAYEAGMLTFETLVSAFATYDDLELFADALADCDHIWVNERHFGMFLDLAESEEAICTYPLIAHWVRSEVLAAIE